MDIFEEIKAHNAKLLGASKTAGLEVRNPANGECIISLAQVDIVSVQKQIQRSHTAFSIWSKKTAQQRAQLLYKWNALILEHKQQLAEICTLECGKPLAESLAEVEYAASFVLWFAEEAKRTYGDVIPSNMSARRQLAIKQPIGVSAAITPWNFPLGLVTRKVAAALAAGCTAVLKPAGETPISSLALKLLAEEAGIEGDVFIVLISGNASAIGKELCTNTTIKKLSFTGSSRVGKLLLSQCADTVTKVSMELGGNAPCIVFDDAEMDNAVDGVLFAKFRNSGQTCVCANKILVHDAVYDEFCHKFTQKVASYELADSTHSGNFQIGPLINDKAIANMRRLLADAVQKGASIQCGGRVHADNQRYFEPTIVSNVTQDMVLYAEEIFGPIASVMRFHEESEAIALANDTEYGLAGYFFSQDINRIIRVSEALECGMIGVNTGAISAENAPFGGVKESGIGREGSRFGIDEYMEVKYICIGNVDSKNNI